MVELQCCLWLKLQIEKASTFVCVPVTFCPHDRDFSVCPQTRTRQFEYVSEEAKDLVHRMLEPDQKQRITVEEALAHPWVRVRIGYTFCSARRVRVGAPRGLGYRWGPQVHVSYAEPMEIQHCPPSGASLQLAIETLTCASRTTQIGQAEDVSTYGGVDYSLVECCRCL